MFSKEGAVPPLKNAVDPCPLCGSERAFVLFDAKDHQQKVAGRFEVARCRDCRLIFLDPMPAASKIEGYYAVEDFYPYETAARSSFRRLKNRFLSFCTTIHFKTPRRALHRLAALLFFPIKKKLVPLPPSGNKILDIGCGNGEYLLNLREIGWDVYGCELSKSGAAAAKRSGLRVVQGSVFDAHYPDAFFDAIRLEQVFEHIHQPDSLLAEIRRILKPAGLLIIGVPHGESLSFQIFGRHWGLLGVPFHLFQYSSGTLQKVLSRNGFQVLEFKYLPTLPCWLWSINNFLSERLDREEGFLDSRLFRWACRSAVFPAVRLLYLLRPAWAEMIQVVARKEAPAPTLRSDAGIARRIDTAPRPMGVSHWAHDTDPTRTRSRISE